MTALTTQLIISALIVIAVLWFMWKLPNSGDRLFGWGPPLALLSAWAGLLAVLLSLGLWFLPYPDVWIVPALLALDPAAIGAGTLVLWIYRRQEHLEEGMKMQMVQAKVGIALGLLAVAMGYIFAMVVKPPFTEVGI